MTKPRTTPLERQVQQAMTASMKAARMSGDANLHAFAARAWLRVVQTATRANDSRTATQARQAADLEQAYAKAITASQEKTK